MSTAFSGETSARGTSSAPRHYEGPQEIIGDVHLSHRLFAYETAGGFVVGKTFSVMFSIERPTRDVWPFLKDFNLWQNPYGHYYSGVVGELEGKTFSIAGKPGEPDTPGPYQFRVLRVIPEHLIVARSALEDREPGLINSGYHVLTLNEFGGTTVISALMMHQSRNASEEEGLQHHRKVATESHRKWRDVFIPTLKNLVREATASSEY